MDSYSVYEPSQKKPNRAKWLIGCGAALVITVCVVLFVVLGGFAGLMAIFGGAPSGLSVEITTPANPIQTGEEFTISVVMANNGTKNLTVDEIQIPKDLLEIALVTGVTHGGVQGSDYGDQTGYDFQIEIAPSGQQTVVFTFKGIAEGDISGNLDVVVGTKRVSTGIRVYVVGDDGDTVSDQITAPTTTELIPYKSVVQIIAIVDLDGQQVEGWTGSGTVISEDGLILTNAHVVLSDRYYEVVDLIVAITVEQDQPPQRMFYADVIQADAQLDLAVIKVRSDLSGGDANFASLGIQPVPIGDSDALSLGDSIVIIGYPGIGGDTITLTRGEVSGFTSEAPYGNRAYIKTSATIAGGNSGGLAANDKGEIIGVPSAVGTGDIDDEFVDCRRLADTNRDGVIDEYDNCVPTGGFINALRPIQLALPMIAAAQSGEVAIQESSGGATQEEYEAEGDVIFTDTFDNNANGWFTGEDEYAQIGISDGMLKISLPTDEYSIVWTELPNSYNNVVMVVDVNVLQSTGDGDFGFICGYQDVDNFTALEISEDGYFIIYKFVNNELENLVDWTYSDLVAAGGPYTLSAYCGADRISFALNNILLTNIVDPEFLPGQVGLIAGIYLEHGLVVGFDNFTLIQQ